MALWTMLFYDGRGDGEERGETKGEYGMAWIQRGTVTEGHYAQWQREVGRLILLWVVALLLSESVSAAPLRVAVAQQPQSALFHIAAQQGFFRDEGVEVEISRHISGKRALLDGLLAGKADLATAAESPVVANSFQYRGYRVIAAINYISNNNRVVARRDAGIERPTDLRNKRVATQEASAVHYFLHLFLNRHGVSENDVELSFMKGNQLPGALARGEIDAFSMREPYVGEAVQLLGEQALVFAEPGLFLQFDLVVVSQEALQRRSEIDAVLRALLRAERFAKQNPAAAIEDVATFSGSEESGITTLWNDYHPVVELDSSLLIALDAEAVWVLQSGLTHRSRVPDMFRLIDSRPLQRVDPLRVRLPQW